MDGRHVMNGMTVYHRGNPDWGAGVVQSVTREPGRTVFVIAWAGLGGSARECRAVDLLRCPAGSDYRKRPGVRPCRSSYS